MNNDISYIIKVNNTLLTQHRYMKEFSNIHSETFSQQINECVIAAKRFKDDNNKKTYVAIKHRDRAYKPTLSVIHTVVNGIEMVLLRDDTTLWMEGMNSAGICILNSALGVETDEKADSIMKKSDKAPKLSKDGERIQKALTMNTIDDAVHFAKTWKMGIQGNTLITDGDELFIVEMSSTTDPVVSKLDGVDNVVRTNHGIINNEIGYQRGESRKSSERRKKYAEHILQDVETAEDMASALRAQPDKVAQYNPLRKSGNLFTSTQLMLNPDTLTFTLYLLKSQIENFKGVVNQLPEGHEPRITIDIHEV